MIAFNTNSAQVNSSDLRQLIIITECTRIYTLFWSLDGTTMAIMAVAAIFKNTCAFFCHGLKALGSKFQELVSCLKTTTKTLGYHSRRNTR